MRTPTSPKKLLPRSLTSRPPRSETVPTPFVARVADMRDVEARFAAVRTVDRVDFHDELGFFTLLVPHERAILQRCFADVLTGNPLSPRATPRERVLWDMHARKLVVRMLEFADETIEKRLHLVYRLAADAPEQALILTTNGSLIELTPPVEDDLRAYRYTPGLGSTSKPHASAGCLAAPPKIGERLQIGQLRTTAIAAIACGRQGRAQRLDTQARFATHFRGLVEALRKTPRDDPDRDLAEAQLVGHAMVIQRRLAGRFGNHRLIDVRAFGSRKGTRYAIRRPPGSLRVDLVVDRGDGVHKVVPEVSVGPQEVVSGAPLVLLSRVDERILGVVEAVDWITPRV